MSFAEAPLRNGLEPQRASALEALLATGGQQAEASRLKRWKAHAKGNRGKMIATALRVFDAVQLNTDAERRWHRVGLWMASLMLLPSGYLMMLGLAAKAPVMGLWASMPFVALASLLYAACRIRGRAITTLSAGAKALSAGAKQEWERCMRTLARLQLRVGTWMCRNALRRLKRQSLLQPMLKLTGKLSHQILS